MNIRLRLLLLLAISISALLAVGLMGLTQSQRNGELVADLTGRSIPDLLTAADLGAQLRDVHLALVTLVHTPDPALREQLQSRLKAEQDKLRALLAAQAQSSRDERQRGLVSQAEESLASYFSALEDASQLSARDQKTLAEGVLYGSVEPSLKEFQQILDTLGVEKRRGNAEAVAGLNQSLSDSITAIGAATVVTLLVLVGIGWALYRQIVLPLRSMETTMGEIAATLDFTRRVPVLRNDEIGHSIRAFNGLIDALQGSLSDMTAVIRSNAVASVELHQSAVVLARIASDGNSSSREIQNAIRDIQSHIETINCSTRQAGTLTSRSGDTATENAGIIRSGMERIQNLAATVSSAAEGVFALADAGRRVASVVAEIRQIADQTNLLALNAAIEAARAGESGRGFAVVADEVRKLAERTAASTVSIAGQITGIEATAASSTEQMARVVAEMEESVALTASAGVAMGSIEQSARQVLEVVTDIGQQVEIGQASGRDIVHQVDQIDSLLTDANTAAIHTKAAADQIRTMSDRMAAIVDRFRISPNPALATGGGGSVDLF